VQVVVDSNILISALDPQDQFHAECFPLFSRLLEQEIRALCPAFVLVETTCVLRRRTKNPQFAWEAYQDLLRLASITWMPLPLETAVRACQLGIETGLKGGDAIVLQAAVESGIPLLTKDREIHAKAPATVQLFEPGNLPG